MAKTKVKKRLFNLDPLEVSFVPSGINGRPILITKSDKEELMDEEILKELLNMELKDEAAIDEKIVSMLPEDIRKEADQVSKIQGTMKAAVKLLKGLAKQLPESERGKVLGNLSTLTGLKNVEKEDPKPEKTKEEIAKEAADVEAKKKADAEKIEKEKKMDPELVKKLDTILKANEDLGTENKGLKEEIKKERDLRVTKEFEEKARKEFPNCGDAEQIGSVLKSAKDTMSEDAYKNFETVMKSNQAKLEAGNIFGEIGSNAGASADLESKIKVKKEAIMKGNSDMTPEQAEARLWEDNPELYNEYLDENPAQGGH